MNNTNTIQYNNKEYHRIAVKRDAEAVAQRQYGFFYAQWDVLIDGTYYLFANSKPIDGVYNLLGTNITIPGSAITSAVYENMEVPVNIPNSILPTTGTLHSNSQHFNYGCSKLTVDQTSGCELEWPSAGYKLNRLVREEDIIKPNIVKLYFDENHIDVECPTKVGIPDYSIVTDTYTGYIERTVGDNLNVSALHDRNSRSYIPCHIGDTIKIISKNKPLTNVAIRPYTKLEGDYPIIGPVDENGNVNTTDLQKDGSFDYIITSDCFVTFDIAVANYALYGAILEDTEYCDQCVVQVNNSDFIIAGNTEQAKRFIQENSKVNINTSLSIYTVEAYTKKRDFAYAGDPEYVLVDRNNNVIYDTNGSEVYVYTEYHGDSLLANSQYLIVLSDSTSLPLAVQGYYNLIEVINLTTNTAITVNYNNNGSHSGNSSAYFTMPASDCLLTVTTNIVTDGDTVTISPRYSLTIDVDENSSSVFPVSVKIGNTSTNYNESTTIQNIENNYFSASWNEVDGKLYHILYKTDYTIFFDEALKTTSYSNSLMGNRTLSIRLIDPDIIYRNTTEISTITVGKKYELNNNIISNSNVRMALNDYPRCTYYANTESPIKTSNTHFNNLQELKKVIFNNTDTTFTVDADAFYNCLKLESVTINGTENIKVKDKAFYNNIMLSEFNDLNKITELGHSCFYGSALNEYKSNVKLKNIPELAFSKSSLSTVNLAGTPIDPAELTSIDNSAFSNCYKLNTVHLPYALIKLGQNVFENTAIPCVHTNPAYADEKVLSQYGAVFNVYDDYANLLAILPKNTFKGCTNLVEAHLPTSINLIETGAFRECNNLKYFTAPGLKMLELGVFANTWIEGDHNYNDLNQTSVSYVRQKNDTSGIYFEFPFWFTRPKDHYVFIKPDDSKPECILYKRLFPVRASDTHITPGNATSFRVVGIAEYGFSHKDNWDLIGVNGYGFEAPYVQTVGKYAFKDTRVLDVTLSSNLSYLGEGAFYNCSRLAHVYGMQDWKITKIPDKAFYNCGGDRYGLGYDPDLPTKLSFNLPNTTEEIGDYAFYNCRQLMGIKNHALCPIKKIGKYAFSHCFRNTHNIWDAVIYTTLFAIKTAATIYCSWYICGGPDVSWGSFLHASVLKVWLNPNVTPGVYSAGWKAVDIIHAVGAVGGIAEFTTGASIGWRDGEEAYPSSLAYAVQSCVRAAKTRSNLIFPHLEELGEGAFSECTYLGRVMLGDAVTHIPDYAFYGCTRLIGVDFCKNIDWNDETAISLFYADSNVKTIGKFSFSKCKNLHDISVDAMLKSATCVKEGAFKDSVVNYSSYLNETEGNVESALTIPDTLTTLEAGSLGFNRKNKFIFISDNPRTKQYSSNTFDGGADSKIFLIVPEGSKNDYMLIFPNVPSNNICEVSKSDSLWTLHKLAGYTIPWLAD